MNLKKNKKINGDSFNIGPHKSKNFSVGKVLKRFALKYRNIKWKLIKEKFKEQNLLNLNCSKIEKNRLEINIILALLWTKLLSGIKITIKRTVGN